MLICMCTNEGLINGAQGSVEGVMIMTLCHKVEWIETGFVRQQLSYNHGSIIITALVWHQRGLFSY